jgi:hypothetical protein
MSQGRGKCSLFKERWAFQPKWNPLTKYVTLARQRRRMKQSPFQVAWFSQAQGSNTVISGTLLREEALHTVIRFGTEDIKGYNGWTDGFKQRNSVVYKTVSG